MLVNCSEKMDKILKIVDEIRWTIQAELFHVEDNQHMELVTKHDKS